MAIRANHYDAAFEEHLRRRQVAYIAVNEAKRAMLDDRSLKSLDFVVDSPVWGKLLIDVKGRRFPQRGEPHGRRWENWATADDLESLGRWETVFGSGFRSLLVFAYWLPPATDPATMPVMLTFRNRHYGFYGVWVDEYRQLMKTRSPKWDTVWLPGSQFRALRFPLEDLGRAPTVTAT